jgi:epoxyqueuosine reductase
MLAIPYMNPALLRSHAQGIHTGSSNDNPLRGRIASYAWGRDYHEVLTNKLQNLVQFIEKQVGSKVPHRYYTDTGPVLERDLAQRAGLGWIGKHTCLINPRLGSYFFLAEVLLGIEIDPDPPFANDHCGTCTRCISACPTNCIQPDRTLDAQRCISYLTIENKGEIPKELRPLLRDWVFGCDVCQMVCPWNRFSHKDINEAFLPLNGVQPPELIEHINLSTTSFNQKFKSSPIKRAKRRGYLRNVAVGLGNSLNQDAIPGLINALDDPEHLIREHAAWALEQIKTRRNG